jgi:hypothetical protein
MIKNYLVKTICLLLLLFTAFAIYADGTTTATPVPTSSQISNNKQSANWIEQGVRNALSWFSYTCGVGMAEHYVTKIAVIIKNAFESLVDSAFNMLCESLLRLWDISTSQSLTDYSGTQHTVDATTGAVVTKPVTNTIDIGVGAKTVTYISGTVMPFLYTLVGVFLYIFVVLKLVTGLFKNESPVQLVGYFTIVVFLIISYTLLYSSVIQLFSHVLGYMGFDIANITTSSLGNNFAATLTNDPDTLNLIASTHNLTFPEIDTIYSTPASIIHLWIGIIAEMLVSCMFVYFIIKLLLLKGQQLIQLFLAYFLGILIIPLTILSGWDMFVRWFKSFVGTCLYSFVWGLLFMLLFAISLSNLTLGTTATAVGLPSIIKLMMYFGVFMLMTQVGKLVEFFTGGDTFGKIAQSGSREFGSMLRSAGTVAAMPAAMALAPALGAASFAGGVLNGAGLLPDMSKLPGFGGGGGKNGGGGGGKKADAFSQSMGGAKDIASTAGGFGYGHGQSLGASLKSGTSDIIKAIRNSKGGGSTPPNDGSAINMPENFVG